MKRKNFKKITSFLIIFVIMFMFNTCYAGPAKINTSVNLGTHDATASQDIGNKI